MLVSLLVAGSLHLQISIDFNQKSDGHGHSVVTRHMGRDL